MKFSVKTRDIHIVQKKKQQQQQKKKPRFISLSVFAYKNNEKFN